MIELGKAYPLVPLRGIVVFPNTRVSFEVSRNKSVQALEKAMSTDEPVFLVTQMQATVLEPGRADVYPVGVLATISQMLRAGEGYRVVMDGLERAHLCEWRDEGSMTQVTLEPVAIEVYDELHTQALMRCVRDAFEDFSRLHEHSSMELIGSVAGMEDENALIDIVAAHSLTRVVDKMEVLMCFHTTKRLEKLYGMMMCENQKLRMAQSIQTQVREQIEKQQRDYFLREQAKLIQKELGSGEASAIDAMRERAAKMAMPEEAREKVRKELDRLESMPAASPEQAIVRTYVEWLLDLPWFAYSEDELDIAHARRILDEDHYGLEKVKQRILEHLAVHALTGGQKSPILCLVGPPGVGKTSIARSVARALGRSFARMSLGGVRDEAEIRGHRRTYIAALPGRILAGLKRAKTANPVFLLDEIDKLGQDMRGNPADALLEVLDPEQNRDFRDHYIEIPFDLSRVLWITTANTTDIPAALLDRMELIQIPGYALPEKREIATRHLIPRQIVENGLKPAKIKFEPRAIDHVIDAYTRESGVRQLERQIGSICRKAAMRMLEDGAQRVKVTPSMVEKLLGSPRFRRESRAGSAVGVSTGLAWTAAGGDTLSIEAVAMPGTGSLQLTGQLGDVMKESAKAALSYIRARSHLLGIADDFYEKIDLHIHIPEGATPKDGPSAGVALVTAMVSALTGRAVRQTVAMTGEITLGGRVLPVGGLKEKTLAARMAGVEVVLYPQENRKDIMEIPNSITEGLTLLPMTNVDGVLARALEGGAT